MISIFERDPYEDGAERPGAAEHAPTFRLLLTTAHRLAIEMNAALELDEISPLELLALTFLVRAGAPQPAKALAAMLGGSRQSASELAARLVRDGLVERAADPHDRRARLLVLTARGRECESEAMQALHRCMSSFSRQFEPEDKAAMHSLLHRLESGADWHRTERLWRSYECAMRPRRRPFALHVR